MIVCGGLRLSCFETRKTPKEIRLGKDPFGLSPSPLSTQRPNVILIFTEGLSKNIIEDERNIMPNVKALQEESISFENYFNQLQKQLNYVKIK